MEYMRHLLYYYRADEFNMRAKWAYELRLWLHVPTPQNRDTERERWLT